MKTWQDIEDQRGEPEVSIVLPSYNHSQFIAQAIDSVLEQTLQSWELIIIDDGSSDSTQSLLEQRYSQNPKIRLIYQSNQGAHRAINRGMALAKGRYISILNSDDVYHPERLQTLLEYLQDRPHTLAFTPVTPINPLGQPITDSGHPWCRLYSRLSHAYDEEGANQALLTGNFAISTSNFFFRTDLLKRVGGFRKKRYNHDWDFMARLIQQGLQIERVGVHPLLFYRLHDNNTINQNTLMARIELNRILHGLVPLGDPYAARLVARITLNQRSIRREHESRLMQQITQDRERIKRQLEAVQQQLTSIKNSRSYRFSKRLASLAARFKRKNVA